MIKVWEHRTPELGTTEFKVSFIGRDIPPSVNELRIPGIVKTKKGPVARLIDSKEYVMWKQSAKIALGNAITDGKLHGIKGMYTPTFYFCHHGRFGRASDFANREKAPIDALVSAGLLEKDSQMCMFSEHFYQIPAELNPLKEPAIVIYITNRNFDASIIKYMVPPDLDEGHITLE